MQLSDLTFITGNAHKVAQVNKFLGVTLAHHQLDLDEIQSLDLHTVAEHKVCQAYEILKKPVMVEDASLTFTAMGRLPGTYIKWFIEELGIPGLAKLAAGLDHQQAVGRVCYALYDGTEIHYFDGEMRGHIVAMPQGEGGFGFDPIFVNDGYDITRAQMNEAEYAKHSYRYDGLMKLKEYLHNV